MAIDHAQVAMIEAELRTLGDPPWRAKLMANRLHRGFAADSMFVVKAFLRAGWTLDDVYMLDQISREWRKAPQNILLLEKMFLAFGMWENFARRLAMEPVLYSCRDIGEIGKKIHLFRSLGLTDKDIFDIGLRKPAVLFIPSDKIEAWHALALQEKKDPRFLVKRLKPLSASKSPDPLPIPESWKETMPGQSAPEAGRTAGAGSPADQPVIPAYTTDISSFEKEPDIPWLPQPDKPTAQAAPGRPAEAIPEPASAAPAGAAGPAPLPSPPAVPPPSEVQPDASLPRAALRPPSLPHLHAEEPAKPLKLVKAGSSSSPPERPDQPPEEGVNWTEAAKRVLSLVSRKWEDGSWEKYRKQNPWIDETQGNQVKVLDLLRKWFSYPQGATADDPRVRFLGCFLLDRNLPREPELRRMRIRLAVAKRDRGKAGKPRIAKLERQVARLEKSTTGLRGLLDIPVSVVYLRLYALRSVLKYNRTEAHPEMLLLPFEQVIPQAECAARGLSIPPPDGSDVGDLEAKAQELRYRANELGAKDAVPWKKPYLNMLLEPTRARFQARLAAYLERRRKSELASWNPTRRQSNPYCPIP